MIPRHGGRDDYAALFHEAGHTEHYAHVDATLPFEFRHLGDNSVTEGFAFLFEHLTEDPAWLEAILGRARLGRVRRLHARQQARVPAPLRGEAGIRAGAARRRARCRRCPRSTRGLLGDALAVEWPARTWLSDVDPGYYAANYLRAWAFETRLRKLLRERFGDEWFTEPAAGALLREIWSEGQRLDADELLAQVTGERIDFAVMLEEDLSRASAACVSILSSTVLRLPCRAS